MSALGQERAGATASVSPAQVDALLRECDSLRASLGKARMARSLLLLLLLGFVGVAGYILYDLWRTIDNFRGPPNVEKIQRIASERLSKNSERYMTQVQDLANKVAPVLSTAFLERAQNDMPQYMNGLQQQREVLAERLQVRLAGLLEDRLKRAMDKHVNLIAAEIPVAKDKEQQDRLMANMHVVAERLVQKYYIDDLKRQLETLYDSWDHFPAAEPGGPDVKLSEQFIDELLQMLQDKLTRDRSQGLARNP